MKQALPNGNACSYYVRNFSFLLFPFFFLFHFPGVAGENHVADGGKVFSWRFGCFRDCLL